MYNDFSNIKYFNFCVKRSLNFVICVKNNSFLTTVQVWYPILTNNISFNLSSDIAKFLNLFWCLLFLWSVIIPCTNAISHYIWSKLLSSRTCFSHMGCWNCKMLQPIVSLKPLNESIENNKRA